MQLHYWRSEEGNYGDDLNPWLWGKLLPGVGLGDASDGVHLIGLGSLLARWFVDTLPQEGCRVVLGAGYGKDRLPDLSEPGWRVYGVRGPLSAAFLGLRPEQALSDPAILLPLHCPRPTQAPAGVGFMPHIFTLSDWDWRYICDRVGLIYLDPRGDWEATTRTIAGLSLIVTEAMHGAIIADAFRTPWIPVAISPRFEHAKWLDWAASVSAPFRFAQLPSLYSDPRRVRLESREALKSLMRRSTMNRAVRPWSSRPSSSPRLVDYAASRLFDLARSDGYLSEDVRLAQAQERLLDAVHAFLSDHQSGVLQMESTRPAQHRAAT